MVNLAVPGKDTQTEIGIGCAALRCPLKEGLTMWKTVSLIAVMAGGITLASPVTAQTVSPVCGDRTKVINSLSAKYSEEPVAVGVTANGGVIEVLKAPDGKTWTILFTSPNGASCLVASGEAWQELEVKLNGPHA